ncbi:transmembrane sensor [Pseudomonas sp. BIGb0408]|uniref:Transmembrane sensor n=1 Tax=Phytopseudomonas flavescens TaxID=29435 RepID=A0A7Y9XSU2_9GAMM|nr:MULTISPECIES: DUF4880 domain-containing protein [Pseudomonas]MCW2294945.1 transmembrane sensor [Pseudomonas sp. BIGb0408]NYH75781.1 transmembrane sensor [Pseudomonas flavescens]
MSEQPLKSVVDEAAHWMMRLQSGDISEDERQAFIAWQNSHPTHVQVFQRLADNLGLLRREPLLRLSDEQVLRTINTPSSRRDFLRGSLAVVGAVALGTLGLHLNRTGLVLPGDLYTATGERTTHDLADGSRLSLDARTRVTPDFGSQRRGLHFHHGGALLDAPITATPLILDSPAGRLSSLGGRLILRSRAVGQLQLTVFDAEVRLANGQQLQPGSNVNLDSTGVIGQSPLRGNESAWLDGLLEVDDRPLGEVVDALRAYRNGVLRLSATAASLRTSGLYPLDDSDRALQLLAQTLPIRISRFGDLWVSIERA